MRMPHACPVRIRLRNEGNFQFNAAKCEFPVAAAARGESRPLRARRWVPGSAPPTLKMALMMAYLSSNSVRVLYVYIADNISHGAIYLR